MASPDTATVTGDEYPIGADVLCGGSTAGRLERVVVDPLQRRLTHLVVTVNRLGDSRLVPLALVAGAGKEITLSCTEQELDALDPVVETRFLRADEGFWGYAAADTFFWPYYGLGAHDPTEASPGMEPVAASETGGLPRGEVAIERGDPVRALDGDVGRVQGLVIDGGDHVTHVLLEEGHLWGKKQVAVPITAVARLDEEGAHVQLTTEQIRDLPPVEIAPV